MDFSQLAKEEENSSTESSGSIPEKDLVDPDLDEIFDNDTFKPEKIGIKAEFVKIGCCPSKFPPGREPTEQKPPISLDNPSIIKVNENHFPGFALNMVKGLGSVVFTSLLFPFISSTSVKGIYLNVGKESGPQQLSITFAHSGDKTTLKDYDFDQPSGESNEWYYLPVNLEDVTACTIEGGVRWVDKITEDGEIDRRSCLSGIRIVRSEAEVKRMQDEEERKRILQLLAPHFEKEKQEMKKQNEILMAQLRRQKMEYQENMKRQVDLLKQQIQQQKKEFEQKLNEKERETALQKLEHQKEKEEILQAIETERKQRNAHIKEIVEWCVKILKEHSTFGTLIHFQKTEHSQNIVQIFQRLAQKDTFSFHLSSKISDLESKVSSSEGQLSEYERKKDEMETSMLEIQSKIRELESKVSSLHQPDKSSPSTPRKGNQQLKRVKSLASLSHSDKKSPSSSTSRLLRSRSSRSTVSSPTLHSQEGSPIRFRDHFAFCYSEDISD
ncbi:hypothetical protein ADUPG1_009268 [Aduncisulcus paluster]|uniref:Uncharacterized protein n=1 Tax=Aduncisulcus paluster TaxID=2918883 RepID=A0ABQ5KW82_9EUKA|nr:hypothetical protein ADUPG1_009268 [Aduncisulcus paluster]